MNLRQKCKKLKAENKLLKNKTIQPLIMQSSFCDINVITYSKEYNFFELRDLSDDMILNDLKRGLAEQLVPYMDIQAYHSFDRSIMRATIRILGDMNNG